MIIAFTVHQRPWYLRQTLESWRKVRGVKDAEVVFHVDPSSQEHAQVAICAEFAAWHRNTRICLHHSKFGVLGNPFHAMENAFEKHKVAALAEEDVEVSDDILEYYEAALFHAWIACAWSDREGAQNEIELREWFNPWGWATTRSAWQEVIAPTWDHDYTSYDERGPGGWDCNLGLRVLPDRGLKAAFPMRSRSRHTGKYLGVHQDPSKHGEQEMPESFSAHVETQEWRLRHDAAVDAG